MKMFFSLLLTLSLCPLCVAQNLELHCITMIDQRLPEQLSGKCFFGKYYADSINIVYKMGSLQFIDKDKSFSKYLEIDTLQQKKWIRLAFDVKRIIGRKKVENRRYCYSLPLVMINENFKYPESLLVCEIITLNKKKDKYVFYIIGNGYVSAIKDRKGKKIHRKTFPPANEYY